MRSSGSPLTSPASHRSTNSRILAAIEPLLTKPLRIIDIGCGSGYLLSKLAESYRQRGWPVDERLLGIDIDASHYGASGVPFRSIDINRPLPFAEGSFDLALAIEVLEHARAPYLLLQDIARMLAPGGRLIMSVPNMMHVLSRLSFLLTGHYYMYPTPSSRPDQAGRLCGHIQPLPLQYWHYGLRYAGFDEITVGIDRVKKGAVIPALLLKPFASLASAVYARRIARYDGRLAEEVRVVLPEVNSLHTLTARSLVLSGRKPI